MPKRFRLLIGYILAAIGVLLIFGNIFSISFGKVALFLLGITFIMLFLSKGMAWALICGNIIIIYSLSMLCKMLDFNYSGILCSMLFLLPGSLVIAEYLNNRNINVLIPGCFMAFIGLYILLLTFPYFRKIAAALLMLMFGLVFLSAYGLSKKALGIWSVIVSFVFLLLGLFLITGNFIVSTRYNLLFGVIVFFIFLCIYFIIRNIQNKRLS